MTVNIKHRVTGEILHTHNGRSLLMANLRGANMHSADLRNADLRNADLSGADLSGADLSGADLSGAGLIDGGQRSDGYRFVAWFKAGELRIRAGCRDFTMAQARAHWAATRGGTPLGEETTAMLDHMERVAKIRGLMP